MCVSRDFLPEKCQFFCFSDLKFLLELAFSNAKEKFWFNEKQIQCLALSSAMLFPLVFVCFRTHIFCGQLRPTSSNHFKAMYKWLELSEWLGYRYKHKEGRMVFILDNIAHDEKFLNRKSWATCPTQLFRKDWMGAYRFQNIHNLHWCSNSPDLIPEMFAPC